MKWLSWRFLDIDQISCGAECHTLRIPTKDKGFKVVRHLELLLLNSIVVKKAVDWDSSPDSFVPSATTMVPGKIQSTLSSGSLLSFVPQYFGRKHIQLFLFLTIIIQNNY